METKSRYEVISDLEKQKRELIKQRDELDFEVKTKERNVVTLKRGNDDTAKALIDFKMKQDKKIADIARETEDFQFRINNTKEDFLRKITDAEEDITNFTASIKQRKETLNELIRSVDANLERFGKIAKDK